MQFGLFHIYNSLSFITEIERHSKGLKRQTRLYREKAWVLKHSPRHAKAAFSGGFFYSFPVQTFFTEADGRIASSSNGARILRSFFIAACSCTTILWRRAGYPIKWGNFYKKDNCPPIGSYKSKRRAAAYKKGAVAFIKVLNDCIFQNLPQNTNFLPNVIQKKFW